MANGVACLLDLPVADLANGTLGNRRRAVLRRAVLRRAASSGGKFSYGKLHVAKKFIRTKRNAAACAVRLAPCGSAPYGLLRCFP